MADNDPDQIRRKLLAILEAVTAFLDGAQPTMKRAEHHTLRLAMVLSVPMDEPRVRQWLQESRADLLPLQALEDVIQHPTLGPAIHASVYGVPRAETLGQSAPFATLFGHIQQGVEKLQVGHFDVAALPRQAGLDAMQLRFADLHSCTISQYHFSVNRP